MLNRLSFVLLLTGWALCRTAAAADAGAVEPYPEVASHWIENQKRRGRKLLENRRYDVLVVPFQVNGHGIDPAGRSLMTLSLAHGVSRNTNLSVANPVLVSKALGTAGRQFDRDEITTLARTLGVKSIIVGDVGHDRHGKFGVRIRTATRDAIEPYEFAAGTAFESATIPFSDTALPYFAFRDLRDSIVRTLFSSAHVTAPERFEAGDIDLPVDVDDFVGSAKRSPLLAAHYLQFLGALAPRYVHDRTRDMLFERSLVLLEAVDPRSSDYRLLEARALAYLNRRPAAVASLGKTQTPAERALLAYLNGNSSQLEDQLTSIESPLLATIAGLESERLRMEYGGASDEELLETMFHAHDLWGPLLYRAYGDSNPWRRLTHVPLKLALDAGFPAKKLSLDTYGTGKMATAGDFDEYEIAQLVFRHLRRIEEDAAGSPRSERLPLGPEEQDFADLMRNMLVGDVYSKVRQISRYVAKPRDALELANEYEPLLADHPALVVARMRALGDSSERTTELERENFEEKKKSLARRSLQWAGGLNADTVTTALAVGWSMPKYTGLPEETRAKLTFVSDWPMPPVGHRFRTPQETEKNYRHCIAYTITNFDCLQALHSALSGQTARHDEGKQLLADNEGRFIGHPRRLDYLTSQLAGSGDIDAAERMYHEGIDAGTRSWKPYERVARKFLLESEFAKALETALKYPGFYDASVADEVTASNRAYTIGSLLYWAGAYESAVPLYELASSYRTGSNAGITSSARLALIHGDYQAAIAATLHRVNRYGSADGIRDLIGLVVIAGDTGNASAILEASTARLSEPQLWIGALLLHRATDATSDEIADWAFADGRDDIDGEGPDMALRYLFLARTLDRVPAQSLAEELVARDPRPRPSRPSDAAQLAMMLPKKARKPEVLAETIEFERLLPYAARALAAIERREYREAFDSLDEAMHHHELAEFLPYYAFAAAKTGDTKRMGHYRERFLERVRHAESLGPLAPGVRFEEYLARAFLHGVSGRHDKAIDMLRRSNGDVVHNEARHVFTRYQILETARLLYRDTGDESYREFALDLARRNAVIEPMQAYTHSFVAMLSDDRNERVAALARVLILDPQSRCLDSSDASELETARERAKDGYPLPGDSAGVGA